MDSRSGPEAGIAPNDRRPIGRLIPRAQVLDEFLPREGRAPPCRSFRQSGFSQTLRDPRGIGQEDRIISGQLSLPLGDGPRSGPAERQVTLERLLGLRPMSSHRKRCGKQRPWERPLRSGRDCPSQPFDRLIVGAGFGD